jgi:hypothetical protein
MQAIIIPIAHIGNEMKMINSLSKSVRFGFVFIQFLHLVLHFLE